VVDADDRIVAAEPDEVQSEAHAERVHAAAAGQLQRDAGRRRAPQREAAEPGESGAGDDHVHAPDSHGRPNLAPYTFQRVQIAERIRADVSTAMKAGERDRVAALRLVLSELQKAAKEGESDELAVLRRERKRRREAEQAYKDAGRDDLAAGEAFEAEAIDAYLPAELADHELDELVRRAVQETGAESPRDMGKAIKHVMAAAGGRADGRTVSTKVKEALG
jgi:uncharacterized protein YqeY